MLHFIKYWMRGVEEGKKNIKFSEGKMKHVLHLFLMEIGCMTLCANFVSKYVKIVCLGYEDDKTT